MNALVNNLNRLLVSLGLVVALVFGATVALGDEVEEPVAEAPRPASVGGGGP